MSAKKMVGRNVAIALAIVCIVLIAGIGGVLAYFTMQIDDRDTKYNGYVATHSHTDSDYNSLSIQMASLQNQMNQVQTWLNGNVTAYSNYVSDHTYTNEQNQNLQNQITSLQNQFLTLNSNYAELMSKYESEIPPNNGISIDSVDWNRMYNVNAGVIEVVVRNWGANALTVTSLKLYLISAGLFDILASSVSVNVNIAGNSTADINTFLPISGFNNYNDTWRVQVYTLEGYYAGSDPLPLVSG
jgi:hypothetical protein